MEYLPHHHHILSLSMLYMIPFFSPPSRLRLKLSKLKGLMCQMIKESLIRLNLPWHKEVRNNPIGLNQIMFICTQDITFLSILHNISLLNMLHKPIKIHITIINICLTPWLKRVIETIHYHNIQSMFHTLGKHIIIG